MAEGWSVNAIAAELGFDRRTVTRRVRELAPVDHGPHGPLFRLGDVLGLLRQDGTLGDLWEPVDAALGALLEAATADLDHLADRLARTRSRELARRLVAELVADAAYRAFHAANPATPPPPDWTKAPDAAFERAVEGLRDPSTTLDEVCEVLEGDGGEAA